MRLNEILRSWNYSYDSDGERIKKSFTDPETGKLMTTVYWFSDYEETFADDTLKKVSKLYGEYAQRVTEFDEAGTVKEDKLDFIFKDILGSPVCTVTSDGTVKDNFVYEPFGKMLPNENADSLIRSFTGHFAEDDEGLYYCHARWYDADIERFLQADSVLDGLNRYAYCHNNPIEFVDPTGREHLNSNTTIFMGDSQSTLGYIGSEETINRAGCVLTTYTRIASAICDKEISLDDANYYAIRNELYTNTNLLTKYAGEELINGLLQENGVTNISVQCIGSFYGNESKMKEINHYLEGEDRYVVARIETYGADGSKFEHQVNINKDAIYPDENSPTGWNISFEDTSRFGRKKLYNDKVDNTLVRLDVFVVKRSTRKLKDCDTSNWKTISGYGRGPKFAAAMKKGIQKSKEKYGR